MWLGVVWCVIVWVGVFGGVFVCGGVVGCAVVWVGGVVCGCVVSGWLDVCVVVRCACWGVVCA